MTETARWHEDDDPEVPWDSSEPESSEGDEMDEDDPIAGRTGRGGGPDAPSRRPA